MQFSERVLTGLREIADFIIRQFNRERPEFFFRRTSLNLARELFHRTHNRAAKQPGHQNRGHHREQTKKNDHSDETVLHLFKLSLIGCEDIGHTVTLHPEDIIRLMIVFVLGVPVREILKFGRNGFQFYAIDDARICVKLLIRKQPWGFPMRDITVNIAAK